MRVQTIQLTARLLHIMILHVLLTFWLDPWEPWVTLLIFRYQPYPYLEKIGLLVIWRSSPLMFRITRKLFPLSSWLHQAKLLSTLILIIKDFPNVSSPFLHIQLTFRTIWIMLDLKSNQWSLVVTNIQQLHNNKNSANKILSFISIIYFCVIHNTHIDNLENTFPFHIYLCTPWNMPTRKNIIVSYVSMGYMRYIMSAQSKIIIN